MPSSAALSTLTTHWSHLRLLLAIAVVSSTAVVAAAVADGADAAVGAAVAVVVESACNRQRLPLENRV